MESKDFVEKLHQAVGSDSSKFELLLRHIFCVDLLERIKQLRKEADLMHKVRESGVLGPSNRIEDTMLDFAQSRLHHQISSLL